MANERGAGRAGSFRIRAAAASLLAVGSVAAVVGAVARPSADDHRAAPSAMPAKIGAYPVAEIAELPADAKAAAARKCRPSASWQDMSVTLHGLMLWGPDARIEGDAGGGPLLDRLLDYHWFARAHPGSGPIVFQTRYGASFLDLTWGHHQSDLPVNEAHVGQSLCVLMELGIPLDRPIVTPEGSIPLRAVLDDLVANFTIDAELDWMTIALALALPPERSWQNKFGHHYTFDDIVGKLANRRLGDDSACAGTHTLYALAVLLQADRRREILGPEARGKAIAYLREARSGLAASQQPDGSWDPSWASPGEAPPGASAKDRAWITGHHLDWMAIVPDGLRLPGPRLRDAAGFVCRAIAEAPGEAISEEDCCTYFHGIRAIRRMTGDPAGRLADE